MFFAMVLIISLAYGLARLFHALNLMPKKFGKDFKEKKARSVALSTMFFVVFLLPVWWWREGGIGGTLGAPGGPSHRCAGSAPLPCGTGSGRGGWQLLQSLVPITSLYRNLCHVVLFVCRAGIQACVCAQ